LSYLPKYSGGEKWHNWKPNDYLPISVQEEAIYALVEEFLEKLALQRKKNETSTI
jgi:hypothetical protein